MSDFIGGTGYVGIDDDYPVSIKQVLNITAETGALETQRRIRQLPVFPSLQFEKSTRKKGKWIRTPEYCGDNVSGFIDNHFSCSECKKEAEINPWGFYILSDFCPNCGADMRCSIND